VTDTAKGVNILERGSQVHFMSEMEALFDFPPAPKLDVFGKLDLAKASAAELRGQAVFFGKRKCSTCHTRPYYTDGLMHNLRVERFFEEKMINGRLASADGPISLQDLRVELRRVHGSDDTHRIACDARAELLVTASATIDDFLGRECRERVFQFDVEIVDR